jgi:Flp pilus assembly protein TadG
MALTHRHTEKRSGAVVVEAAVALPIFLLLVFGIFEYGRLLLVRNLVDHAVREGARYAVVRADDDETQTQDILDFVMERLSAVQYQLSELDVQIYEADPIDGSNVGSWRNAGFGDSIAVELSGTYQPAVANFIFLPDSIQLRARSVMKSEAN